MTIKQIPRMDVTTLLNLVILDSKETIRISKAKSVCLTLSVQQILPLGQNLMEMNLLDWTIMGWETSSKFKTMQHWKSLALKTLPKTFQTLLGSWQKRFLSLINLILRNTCMLWYFATNIKEYRQCLYWAVWNTGRCKSVTAMTRLVAPVHRTGLPDK